MGRGTKYSWWRKGLDRAGRLAYGSGWAARAAFDAGLQGELHAIHHHFELPGLAPQTSLRLAFASDLHAGPLTDPRLFHSLTAAIVGFKADLVLLGGDYVSLDAGHIRQLLDQLGQIRSHLGVFAVLGNHDLWLDDVAVVQALRRAAVDVLVNEVRHLRTPAGHLRLYGMDEPNTGNPEPPKWEGASTIASLVLMHSPLGLEHLRGARYDIAFCGHTHGGQIALPGGIPIVLPRGSGERRYARGEFLLSPNGSRLLVSRGVGMSDLPVRLFAPSEVHLCTLSGPDTAGG